MPVKEAYKKGKESYMTPNGDDSRFAREPKLAGLDKDGFIKKYIAFIYKLAKKNKPMIRKVRSYSEEADLVSVGMLAFLDAHRDFDPSFNIKFISLLGRYVDSAMKREIANTSWEKAHYHEKRGRIERIVENLKSEGNQNPSSMEISEKAGLSVKRYEGFMLSLVQHRVSMDTPYENDMGRDWTLADVISAGDKSEIQKMLEGDYLPQLYQSLRLPQRDKEILALRVEDQMTLQEIGDKLSLSRERVRQILERVKKAIESYRIKEGVSFNLN